MTPLVRRVLGIVLICSGLLSFGIGIRLWFPPARYEARTRIKVERDVNATNTYSAYFMHNEFELIQSEVILGKVVEALGLHAKWKRDGRKLQIGEAVAMLKARLDLRPVRCTSLVEIHITSEDPDEAAKITNAIAEEYHNHHITGGYQTVSADIVDSAAIPHRPLAPNRVAALCWLVIGSVFAVTLVCFRAKRLSGGNGEISSPDASR